MKQLYGYSIINWELYLKKISKAESEKNCSFCRDVRRQEKEESIDMDCNDCRIKFEICNYKMNGIYSRINRAEIKVDELIVEIIKALRIEYNKL